MKTLIIVVLSFIASQLSSAQETLRITTWNIEHLGGSGRGLGGIGSGTLGERTPAQMEQIAKLIEDSLHSDIIAIQEVALNRLANAIKKNDMLDTLLLFLGTEWKYVIGSTGKDEQIGHQVDNLQNAFLWNSSRVTLIKDFDMNIPNIEIGKDKHAFDRQPLVGYFEAIDATEANRTDFLLVNVHFKSGQDNDENHLAAMVIIERNLNKFLKSNSIKESDRAILGDFNDNPFDERYSDLMYTYMQSKKYIDLKTEGIGATRMNDGLTSIIDHILVNNSIRNEMNEVVAEKYIPSTDSTELALWRRIFSDHFPISFELRISSDTDVD